ncbi:MAG: glutamine--fructose-6-phosphate transaminase (isomerizing) [Clostridia bacterium]|nr:glutamine--fructose-6-phosphate transaminase (isomerizing) [Clostridia bacterium]
MCGIVGFTGNKPASPILLDGLEKLEYRGYDSAGIAVLNDNKIKTAKTTERIRNLFEKTDNGKTVPGSIGIGHTRWATHGGPSTTNAHPHLSGDAKFAVVHNGIIENYVELKEELISEGVEFASETDTEVVPRLLEKYYKGDLLDAVCQVVKKLDGSFALGIICTDYPETLVAAKKFSPLIIGKGKGENYIASDVTALISHTRDVVYLEDDTVAVLTKNDINLYDYNKNEVAVKVSHINWDIAAAEKGGYDYFMMKEMCEEPRAIRQTIEPRIKDGEVVLEDISLDKEALRKINRISIVACGSAYHAGIVGKYVMEEMLRIPVDVDLASEYRYRNPITDSKTLTIIISQSGETADTLAALNEAKQRGSRVLSIVNVVGSSIAKASDDVIYTWAGPEIAVATTKGYTTQLSVLYLFAIWAAKTLGTVDDKTLSEITNSLKNVPNAIDRVLDQKDKIREMAKHSVDSQSLFFIGRNIDYAVSLEASLKLKEISYIHSEAYAAGELKHGTISLIEEGRTVIALACQTDLYDKMLSNIKEVRARGAYVVACANEGETGVAAEAEEVIYIPRVHKFLRAAVEIIPFQLYAYYVAELKGLDIDKPRNLAKSVTVE